MTEKPGCHAVCSIFLIIALPSILGTGCDDERFGRGIVGQSCVETAECQDGLTCVDQICGNTAENNQSVFTDDDPIDAREHACGSLCEQITGCGADAAVICEKSCAKGTQMPDQLEEASDCLQDVECSNLNAIRDCGAPISGDRRSACLSIANRFVFGCGDGEAIYRQCLLVGLALSDGDFYSIDQCLVDEDHCQGLESCVEGLW